MGHGRGKSCSDYAQPVIPIADYNVTGEIDPDAKCNYFESGQLNGKPYYAREDSAWFIWWNGINTWFITTVLGVFGTSWWTRTFVNIDGPYFAAGGAAGFAVVAAGPH